MDWERRFLQALASSCAQIDESPDWRDGLRLYAGLTATESAALDHTLLAMIDLDYRNPYSSHEALPFEGVEASLPAGMSPDDLLCIEAAVMVAAERNLGQAFFATNRLMRVPRWHALYPRLRWLHYEGFAAQQKLSTSRAGRGFGALLGEAVATKGQSGRGEGRTNGSAALFNLILRETIAHGLIERLSPESEAMDMACRHLFDRMLSGISATEAAAASMQAVRPCVLPWNNLQEREPCEVGRGEGALGILTAALWCILTTSNLQACVEAVQALPRAEAVVEVTGMLAGALYGPLAVPREWSIGLPDREAIEDEAERLYAHYVQMEVAHQR